MESIGHILKAARERRQISVADVVAATKMTSTYVKAIEADDFGALVAPVYARGFIKLHAMCVGLDPMPLLKQFDASIRALPALPPLPAKAPPGKASVAHAAKMNALRLQQRGPLPSQGAMGKPEQEQAGDHVPARSAMRSIAGKKALGSAVLANASPLQADAHEPMAGRPLSWFGSLLAVRWTVLSRPWGMRFQWPQVKLPGRMVSCFQWPALVWRRVFIVASVILLIIAASMAWDWSQRGLPSATDACRWLAEPPAPYLAMEIPVPPPGR